MLHGNGVTKNFLSILQSEHDKSGRRLIRLLVLATVVGAVAALFFVRWLWQGVAAFGGVLAAAALLGALYAHFVTVRRYNGSIAKHWNRWMRYSVSCVTVQECYKKVHDRRPGPGVLWLASILAVVIIAHLALAVMAINAAAGFNEILPLFALDAALIGFFLGKRLVERLWYKRFLDSVNELLREGAIGVWGVY
jgi:Flp pilus assembly protein TadB